MFFNTIRNNTLFNKNNIIATSTFTKTSLSKEHSKQEEDTLPEYALIDKNTVIYISINNPIRNAIALLFFVFIFFRYLPVFKNKHSHIKKKNTNDARNYGFIQYICINLLFRIT